MPRRYYGSTEGYEKCPLKGNCIFKGIRCRKDLRCTWLEFEIKVLRWKEEN